jgi:hypothetical protein
MTSSKLFTSNEGASNVIRQNTYVAGVLVTVMQSESHQFTANVPKIALESGAQVSDHMILEPVQVTVQFAITNSGDGKDRARDAFDAFKKMQEERQLVELDTEHTIYTDMVLTSLTPLHAAPYEGSLTFSATFQKIHFVEVQSSGTAAPASSPAKGSKTAKTAGSKKQAGRIEPKEYKRSGLGKLTGKAA